MQRQVIEINEALCNGCGECVTECSEGALQIVDGKAKLVKEQYCDGFGDCIGSCPTGALKIEMREVEDFDKELTKKHLLETEGLEAVWRMEDAHQRHNRGKEIDKMFQGCPGSQTRVVSPGKNDKPAVAGFVPQVLQSELRQWPVQLHLVQPGAPFFKNKELVVMNPCGPIASADVHWRYLRGRSIVIGCPKFDDTSDYAEKLGEILKESSIPRVIVVRMEVPCCGGLTAITAKAVQSSGRKDLIMEEHVLSLDGSVIKAEEINVSQFHRLF